MTGTTIKVDDAAILAALAGLTAVSDDLGPLWQSIGEDLVSSTKERFRTKTDPDGEPWAPLNPIYAATKKGSGILVETGQLAGQIVWQVAGGDLFVGTNRPHARVHQFGAVIKPVTAAALVFEMGGQTFRRASVRIPARPFLGISVADRATIEDSIADFLDAASGGALTGSSGA